MIDEIQAGRLRFGWERGLIVCNAVHQDLQHGARLTEAEVRKLSADLIDMLDSRPAPIELPPPVEVDPFA